MNTGNKLGENNYRSQQAANNRGLMNFENMSHRSKGRITLHPFDADIDNSNAKQKEKKPKKKSRYPIFSYIQELQDSLQTLFASGTSLSGIKTIEMTESDIRMLPITIGARLFGKGLVLIMLYFLFGILGFTILNLIPKDFAEYKPIAYMAFSASFIGSFLFYRYVIASMRQFVIIDENIKKTQAFYSVVKNTWRFVMMFFVIVAALVFAIGYFKGVILQVLPLELWLRYVSDFFDLNLNSLIHIFFESFLFMGVHAVILLAIYWLGGMMFEKRFKRMQADNNVKLYREIDTNKAIDILATNQA